MTLFDALTRLKNSSAATLLGDFSAALDGFYSALRDNAFDEQIDSLMSNLYSDNYSRMLFGFRFAAGEQAGFDFIGAFKAKTVELYGEDSHIAGESVVYYDISNTFGGDMLKVNLFSIIAILLIIGLTFMSLSIPVLLVVVIQGAIYIMLGICALIGDPIFFMSYLICICILMGATIDYGILLTGYYEENRRSMSKFDAAKKALSQAMPTILTSGIILAAAGFLIGFISTVMPIYSIGRLLGIGTLISMALVMLLLPAMLVLLDKPIAKTTRGGKAFVAETLPAPAATNNDVNNSVNDSDFYDNEKEKQ